MSSLDTTIYLKDEKGREVQGIKFIIEIIRPGGDPGIHFISSRWYCAVHSMRNA